MAHRALLICIGVFTLCVPTVEARNWTDTSGNRITADYVRVHEGLVILRQGSRLIKCPYEQFSEEDKAYIRQQMEGENSGLRKRSSEEQDLGETTSAEETGSDYELRTWTDVQGRRLLATYSDFVAGDIELVKDGSRVTYPYNLFSAADQAYVDAQLRSQGREDEIPAKATGPDEGGPMGTEAAPDEEAPTPYYTEPGSDSSADEYDVTVTSRAPRHEGTSPPPMGMPSSPPSYSPPSMPPSMASSMPPSMPPSMVPSMPPTTPPSMHHTPRPSMPSPGPSPSYGAPQMVYSKECMKCKKELPASTKIGDTCPGCGVKFEFEEDADGEYRDAKGRKVSPWVARGGGFGILFFLLAIGVRVFISMAGRD